MADNWFRDIARRLSWATKVLVMPGNNPVIKLDNGVTLDLVRNRIILEGDLGIHVTGNLDLSADGDIVMTSGIGHGRQTGQVIITSPPQPEFGSLIMNNFPLEDEGTNGNISTGQ